MNSRGAGVLAAGAAAVGIALALSTGGQSFNHIATLAPVYGTGSSGSALVFRPIVSTGLFGDCSDGDVTLTVSASLGGDAFYRNLTINSGATLTTAGYAVHVCETLTFVDATSKISWDGLAGSGSTPAAARSAATLPGTRGGGQGGIFPSPAVAGLGPSPGIQQAATSTAAGGASSTTVGAAGANGGVLQGGGGGGGGGDGTHVGAGGATTTGSVYSATNGDPRDLFQGLTGRTIDLSVPWGPLGGASGGGYGAVDGITTLDASGGGAGGPGGWMVVRARDITGAGFITSRGGHGGNGSCPLLNVVGFPVCTTNCGIGGGGGGGEGGVIVLVTETSVSSWNNLDVGGAAGGSTASCGGNLQFGGAGGSGGSGVVIQHRLRLP